ncbi:MAG: hypothetical protein ACKORI_06610, partial [Verrucomicrobiota bacterium]
MREARPETACPRPWRHSSKSADFTATEHASCQEEARLQKARPQGRQEARGQAREARSRQARRRSVPVGTLGRLIDSLKELGAAGAVMAGQVTPRKLFSGMVPDLRLVALLARLKERNAETIFGAV